MCFSCSAVVTGLSLVVWKLNVGQALEVVQLATANSAQVLSCLSRWQGFKRPDGIAGWSGKSCVLAWPSAKPTNNKLSLIRQYILYLISSLS